MQKEYILYACENYEKMDDPLRRCYTRQFSIVRVTPLLYNLQRNKKLRSKLLKKLNNILLFATLRSQLQCVKIYPLQRILQRTVAIMAQVGERDNQN